MKTNFRQYTVVGEGTNVGKTRAEFNASFSESLSLILTDTI